jgi:hypothetical protein
MIPWAETGGIRVGVDYFRAIKESDMTARDWFLAINEALITL